MEPARPPDIIAFLQAAEKWIGDELDLSQLKAGDRLLVHTQNTRYLLLITGANAANLTVDRPDRPQGPVRIQGCTFGRSKMIKPDHLFCGGGLEFTMEADRQTYTTSPIRALQLVSVAGGAPAAP